MKILILGPKMIGLVDGDVLVYRVGFAGQKTQFQLTTDNEIRILDATTRKQAIAIAKELKIPNSKLQEHLVVEPLPFVLHSVKMCLLEFMRLADIDMENLKVFITSTDKSNFRFGLYPEYKANRIQAKPFYYNDIREYLLKVWKAKEIFDIEADDALGIEQDKTSRHGSIIASIDKDLDMIPGMHFNFLTKDIYETRDPGSLELSDKGKIIGGGLKWFYAQLLLGDRADNIPGIHNYGPKKVYKLLKYIETESDLFSVVYTKYLDQYLTIDKACAKMKLAMDLLWIQRVPNDCKSKDFEKLYDECFIPF